ncbi:extracellular solute-binding protein [Arcanobacterium hippocoleae]
MDIRRKIFAAAAAAGFALSGCSPAANQTQPDSPEDAGSAKTAITFRLWDETAKASYERSFKEFTKQNPDIDVKLELVPWDNYWKQIPLDISAGQMADVYLVNSANFAQYADAGNLLDISKTVGSKHEQWQKSVVDLYTRNGVLWGVPQLWDSIALFYNKDLLEKADVDPTKLTWAPFTADGSPASEDTFLPAAKN